MKARNGDERDTNAGTRITCTAAQGSVNELMAEDRRLEVQARSKG